MNVYAVYQETRRWRLFATEQAAIRYLESIGAIHLTNDEWIMRDTDGEIETVYILEMVAVEE